MPCEDQITPRNLTDAKTDTITLGEVATSRAGAESGGVPITQSTNRFGETTDTIQGRLNKLGVLFDDPIKDWSASLLVSDLRAHRYPATTGEIYIPVKPLPFTTGGTFNTDDWELFQGLGKQEVENNIINDISQAYEFDTFADMVSSTIQFTLKKRLITKGYYLEGDEGGASYIVDNGVSSIGSPTILGGLRAKISNDGDFNADKYGVKSGDASSQTNRLNDCLKDALAADAKGITLNHDIVCVERIINASELTITGTGSIDKSNPNNYNIVVNRAIKPSVVVSNQGSLANSWFSRAIFKNVINIVLVGDSISTVNPDTLTGFDSMTTILENKLRVHFSGKKVNFFNRAIGGATMEAFNASSLPLYLRPIATANAPWYTNFNEPWISYVTDLDPDLVIIGFGMNGENTTGAGYTSLNEVWTKFNDLDRTPSLAFVTTPTPSNNDEDSTFSGYGPQSRRNHFAEMTRQFATTKNAYVVDVNRLQQRAVFGLDPVNYYKEETFNFNIDPITESSAAKVCNTQSRYFSLFVDVEVQVAPLQIQFNIHSIDGATFNNSIQITSTNVRVFTTTRQMYVIPITATVGTFYKFKIHHDRNHLIILQDDVEILNQTTGLTFENYFDSSIIVAGGITTKNLRVFEFKNGDALKGVTNGQAWGKFSVQGDYGTKPLIGGNSVNHPSTIGLNAFYTPALEELIRDIPARSTRLTIYNTPSLNGSYSLLPGNDFTDFSYCIFVFGNPSISKVMCQTVPREVLANGYTVQQIQRKTAGVELNRLINITITGANTFSIIGDDGGAVTDELGLIIGII